MKEVWRTRQHINNNEKTTNVVAIESYVFCGCLVLEVIVFIVSGSLNCWFAWFVVMAFICCGSVVTLGEGQDMILRQGCMSDTIPYGKDLA